MPAVFVHGVPETPTVWDPLIVALGRPDTVSLQLPGFGCPLPDGFDAEMNRFADWLAAELAAIDGPIDLVSHDWGALLALRVVSTRPDAVRSWVSDMGDLDATFTWHDMARVWQTPGEGEALVDAWIGQSVDDRAEGLADVGVPHHAAVELSAHMDTTMGAAILTLYRSAVDIGTEWGPALDDITAPGLLIEATDDGFREPGRVAALATRIGAELAQLPDNGHWWMLQDPAGSAAIITDFWARL
jgi:pimeloyl-ACP methyl ester carboxylesterase